MSFGGSGNSQSTSPVTTTTTTNSDNRIVADGGAAAINSSGSKNSNNLGNGSLNLSGNSSTLNLTTNTTDAGTVAGAFDFARASDASASDNYKKLLSTSGDALNGILSFTDSSNKQASANYQSLLDGAGSVFSKLQSDQQTTLSSLLGGIASTQNFIASTAADAKGTMDNKTIMTLGLAALGVVAFIAFRRGGK